MNKDVMARIAGLSVAILLLAGCSKETLFRSRFDSANVGQVPTTADIGTVTTGGAVTVIDAPVLPSGKWVQMSRPNTDTAPALFQGNLTAVKGNGHYVFAATVRVPAGTQGLATIQFGPQNLPPSGFDSFLHLDLMPDGHVRIDDDPASEFGSWTHDKPFIVQVTLDVDDSPTVNIALAGDGASGTADKNITLAPHIFGAKQFGSVRLSMSFPHLGVLQATHISVTRRKD
jgi:hypothetical protein